MADLRREYPPPPDQDPKTYGHPVECHIVYDYNAFPTDVRVSVRCTRWTGVYKKPEWRKMMRDLANEVAGITAEEIGAILNERSEPYVNERYI